MYDEIALQGTKHVIFQRLWDQCADPMLVEFIAKMLTVELPHNHGSIYQDSYNYFQRRHAADLLKDPWLKQAQNDTLRDIILNREAHHHSASDLEKLLVKAVEKVGLKRNFGVECLQTLRAKADETEMASDNRDDFVVNCGRCR